MKWKHFEKYFVLCHANTRYHAGWMVCPYILEINCTPNIRLHEIDTKKGITYRFDSHIDEHEKKNTQSKIITQNVGLFS